jgi:hypothetical protein
MNFRHCVIGNTVAQLAGFAALHGGVRSGTVQKYYSAPGIAQGRQYREISRRGKCPYGSYGHRAPALEAGLPLRCRRWEQAPGVEHGSIVMNEREKRF